MLETKSGEDPLILLTRKLVKFAEFSQTNQLFFACILHVFGVCSALIQMYCSSLKMNYAV